MSASPSVPHHLRASFSAHLSNLWPFWLDPRGNTREFEAEFTDSDEEAGRRLMSKWTKEQDAALRRAVKAHDGKNWKLIADAVPGRTHVQCLQRWKKVLQPGLVKGHWTKEEDDLLRRLITTSQNAGNWAYLAEQIPGRTAKQCRERWCLNLNPEINHGPWTSAEDKLLLKLHGVHGNKWAEIASKMPGRTENAVKTRYKSLLRAKQKLWTVKEDAIIIECKKLYKKRWVSIALHLDGRSKNAIKLRWKHLVGIDPTLETSPVNAKAAKSFTTPSQWSIDVAKALHEKMKVSETASATEEQPVAQQKSKVLKDHMSTDSYHPLASNFSFNSEKMLVPGTESGISSGTVNPADATYSSSSNFYSTEAFSGHSLGMQSVKRESMGPPHFYAPTNQRDDGLQAVQQQIDPEQRNEVDQALHTLGSINSSMSLGNSGEWNMHGLNSSGSGNEMRISYPDIHEQSGLSHAQNLPGHVFSGLSWKSSSKSTMSESGDAPEQAQPGYAMIGHQFHTNRDNAGPRSSQDDDGDNGGVPFGVLKEDWDAV